MDDPVPFRVDTPYFDSLFDDFGIWQHADGNKPLPEHGYALDDATRGFIICLALGKEDQAATLLHYIERSRKGTDFYGFYNAKRIPIQFPASEDAKGQVYWALGYASDREFQRANVTKLAKALTQSMLSLQSLRGITYALLGALYIDNSLSRALKAELVQRFTGAAADWLWPEKTLTYANGLIPYALLRYALIHNDTEAANLGRRVLVFLEATCTQGRIRGPIGNISWYTYGDDKPARNGQQPIDTTAMIMAWTCAYQLSGEQSDLEAAKAWMQWYEGKNIARERMYEPDTLKAYDGIHQGNPDHHDKSGRNTDSGAESNICYLLARYTLETRATL